MEKKRLFPFLALLLLTLGTLIARAKGYVTTTVADLLFFLYIILSTLIGLFIKSDKK